MLDSGASEYAELTHSHYWRPPQTANFYPCKVPKKDLQSFLQYFETF